MFKNLVLKRSPCLTNVADAAFTAYFVHYISAVDDWDLYLFVAKEPTNGVRRVEENTNVDALNDPFDGFTRPWFIGQFYRSDPLSL